MSIGIMEDNEGDYLDDEEVTAVLSGYHRQQLAENMTGPTLSLVTHTILLTLMFIFIIDDKKPLEENYHFHAVVEKPEIKIPDKPALPALPKDNVDDMGGGGFDSEEPRSPLVEAGSDTSPDDTVDDVSDSDNDASDTPLPFQPILGKKDHEGEGTRRGDGDGLPGIFKNRPNGPDVRKGPAEGGVNRCLKWLVSVQQDNGAWGNDSPAHTGMALLVFLGHGDTLFSEKYGTTVMLAMKWLMKEIMTKGNLGQNAYGHGIATYAVAESVSMTDLPQMRPALEKAVQVIIDGQQAGGGFDYGYAKGKRWDLSVSGWQIQALKAAYVAGALNEGLEEAIVKSVRFLRKSTYANYKFGYTTAGSGGNMTGVGVVGLQLNGLGGTKEARSGLKTITSERFDSFKMILKNPGAWDRVASSSLYGWYYDTQAVFNRQGKEWDRWKPMFQKVLIKAQHNEGYWEVTTGHGMGATLPGRIMATCWSALQLEVFYRYLPTFNQDITRKHNPKVLMATLKDERFDDGNVQVTIDEN